MINSLKEASVGRSSVDKGIAVERRKLSNLSKYAAVMVAAALAGCGDDSESSVMNNHLLTPAVNDAGDASIDEQNDAQKDAEIDAVSESVGSEEAAATESGTDGAQPLECGDMAKCNEECVDTTTDPENCGSCGNACNGDKPYCSNGGCTECSDGLRNCHDGQGCINFENNDKNCGGCGNACDPGKSCLGGNCQ